MQYQLESGKCYCYYYHYHYYHTHHYHYYYYYHYRSLNTRFAFTAIPFPDDYFTRAAIAKVKEEEDKLREETDKMNADLERVRILHVKEQMRVNATSTGKKKKKKKNPVHHYTPPPSYKAPIVSARWIRVPVLQFSAVIFNRTVRVPTG